LQDTFTNGDGDPDPEEDDGEGYDSEGWASEAANESYDGGNDREVYGSWEEGTIWIGPKRAPLEIAPTGVILTPPSVFSSAMSSIADEDEEENEVGDEDDEDEGSELASDEEDEDDSEYYTNSSDEDDDGEESEDEEQEADDGDGATEEDDPSFQMFTPSPQPSNEEVNASSSSAVSVAIHTDLPSVPPNVMMIGALTLGDQPLIQLSDYDETTEQQPHPVPFQLHESKEDEQGAGEHQAVTTENIQASERSNNSGHQHYNHKHPISLKGDQLT
jgi:hypothetical protein